MINFRPNQVEIDYIHLENFEGKVLDITPIFTKIEIEEDIFSSTLMGRISIVESSDFQQNFPLIGEESLIIKYRTHSGMKHKELKFYCYSMTDKLPIGQKMGYVLHFASEEYITSRTNRVNRSFKALSAEKIISTVLSDEAGSKKPIITSKTADPITFIATNIYPFALISSIMSRSKGAKHGDYGFVFFESTDGFHFQSIDELIDKTPIKYTLSNRAGTLQEEDTLHTVNAFQVDETHNVLSRMDDGTYGSEVLVFDPIKRKVTTKTFDYFNDEHYAMLNNTAGQSPSKRLHTSGFKFKAANKRILVVDNGVRSEGRALRLARMNWLNSGFRMRIEIPGNSDLHVGDTINLVYPSHSGDDIEKANKTEDRFLSGKYLNISMMHIIEKSSTTKYTCTCEVVRDSFEASHEEKSAKLGKRLQFK